MLFRLLGGARDHIRRLLLERRPAARTEGSDPSPVATPPANPDVHDVLAGLSARLDHLAEGFELWRRRMEADQLAWQRLFADEARARDARIWDQLFRASTQHELERFGRGFSLRPPRVPSDLAQSSSAPQSIPDSLRTSPPGPVVRGLLEQASLASLLSLFELERRDGIFRLSAPQGTVELDLRRGAIVRARQDGQESDVVAALGRAFEFGAAEFHFTSVAVTSDSDAPRSVNGLLLEVLHRHDESRRTG